MEPDTEEFGGVLPHSSSAETAPFEEAEAPWSESPGAINGGPYIQPVGTVTMYPHGEGPPTADGANTVRYIELGVQLPSKGAQFFAALNRQGGLNPEQVKAFHQEFPCPDRDLFSLHVSHRVFFYPSPMILDDIYDDMAI